MPQSNRRARHVPVDAHLRGAEDHQERVEELRVAMYVRLARRAAWMSHRRECPQCRAVLPPGDPRAACFTGRPLLIRLLEAHERVATARRELEPPAVVQAVLF